MKNLLLILIFISKVVFAFSQKLPQDTIDYYIKNLNWKSVFLKINYGTELVLTKDAQRLVDAKDDKTVRKLFCEMSNQKKTVAIHVILTKMFEPDKVKFNGESIYKKDTVIAVNYSCNTLKWQYDVVEDKYNIASEAIKQIKEYWIKKLPLLQIKSNVMKRKKKKK